MFLVTGGAGFIGSNLTDKLLSEGNSVIVIDNFDNFYDRKIKENNLMNALSYNNFKLIEGDIRDKNILAKIFSENEIDIVFQLAAKVGVRPSIKEPELFFEVNVNGTLNILEAMKRYGVKKLIFASSSSIYGNNKKVPFSEKDNVDLPISPYAATKKACELLNHTYHHLYGFNIYNLRFFTVYGPRQRPDLAIHKFAQLILTGEPIPVFGNGNTSRDYTYIDDIIQGIMSAIKKVKGYEIINLGESKTITLSKLIAIIENTVGEKAIVNRLPIQPGDVEKTFADISKAKQLLGYNPKTNIEDGIKKFVEWISNKQIYDYKRTANMQ